MADVSIFSRSTVESQIAELQSVDTEALKTQLSLCLDEIASSMLRMAAIVRVLEDRGEDLDALKLQLLPTLRLIAHGQIAPEAVVRFASQPPLLRLISKLPIPDQKRLGSGDAIDVAEYDAHGQITTRRLDPLYLGYRRLRLIIADTHVRTPAEQIAVLQEARTGPQKPRKPRVNAIVADPDKGGLTIGKAFYSAAEIVSALAKLHGDDADAEPTETITTKLSVAEKTTLKHNAVAGGKSVPALVRHALKSLGLI